MIALRRTTGIALVLTYALIVLGAWVRATGSGLACPDWPTCYGYLLPLPGAIPADAGYAYHQVMLEWAHRLLAGAFLGPLVLVIAVLAWRARSEDDRLPAHAVALVALLVVQAGLGGVTVLDQNSPWSVALHLTTALLLFSVLWLIFARTAPVGASLRAPALPLSIAVWLLALGAMASAAMTTKSGASLACASWPLCNEALIPDFSDAGIRLNLSHRILAAGVGLGALALLVVCRDQPRLRALAGWALALVAVAIALGALVVIWQVPIAAAVLHQAAGVLVFGLLSLLMWRCSETAPAPRENRAHVRLSDA
jgi:cytochrome c oxidase assembly protein subunit 15